MAFGHIGKAVVFVSAHFFCWRLIACSCFLKYSLCSIFFFLIVFCFAGAFRSTTLIFNDSLEKIKGGLGLVALKICCFLPLLKKERKTTKMNKTPAANIACLCGLFAR